MASKMCCTLWLIRHGESIWNIENRIQGQSNPPLSELGIKQAESLRDRLSDMAFEQVYASDLDRAIHTAHIVFPNRKVIIDRRLRERSLGALEGKKVSNLTSKELESYNAWKNNPELERPLNGETLEEIKNRTASWIDSVPKSGNIIAFTHVGTIKAIIYQYLQILNPAEYELLIGNVSISKLLFTERKTILVTINDTAHLKATLSASTSF